MKRTVVVPVSVAAVCVGLAAGATSCTMSAKTSSEATAHRKVAGTAHHQKARATSGVLSPLPGVDLHSASAVAVADVEATWTLNTMVDAGWYAGELAASAYMTPRYAASIRQNLRTGSPGATWMTWAAHRVDTSVSAQVEADPGGPMSTAFTAYRKVIATVTPHGTATATDATTRSHAVTPANPVIPRETQTPNSTVGWVGQSEIWITYLVLSRTSVGAPWRVALSETTQ
jgi:hypothetical protein